MTLLRPMIKILTTTLLTLMVFIVQGQSELEKPSVFIDCQTNCHTTFLRQEHGYFNYKRERQGADVYVLITDQGASAGAREVQLIFDYSDACYVTSDTIKYFSPANISESKERELFVKNFKKGMLPVLLGSDLAEHINYEIEHLSVIHEETEMQVKDPWKYWSFNVGLNMRVNGESRFTNQSYQGRLSASQVKDSHKIFFFTRISRQQSSFTLSDGEEVKSENNRNNFFVQYVKSINERWSIGGRAFAGSSSFGNTDFESFFRPAVEYNIFPYSESSTRRFSFLYSVGLEYNNYMERTVFDKLDETRIRQGLDVEYMLTQPWGNITFDMRFNQYLHDLSLYSLSFNPNIELNLVQGLSLEFGGFVSFVGDRINVAQGEVSTEDIILGNRQLDTDYSYSSYVGFNYRFGTKNNNVVNPRF